MTTQNNKLFSDESGCLDNEKGFVVVSVIRFITNRDYKHWERIAINAIQDNKELRMQGEIKGGQMSAPIKNKVFSAIQSEKVEFCIWVAIINKNDPYYIKKYVQINQDKETVKKEIVFNYAFNTLFQESIAPAINEAVISIDLDVRAEETGAQQNLKQYINTSSKNNPHHQCNEVVLEYKISHSSYGIQLADLVSNTIYRYLHEKENYLFQKYLKNKIQGVYKYPTKK